MGDNTTERWVTLREAAVALGVSKETVRQRFKAGTLAGQRDNHGRILVARAWRRLGDQLGGHGDQDGRRGASLAPTAEALLAKKDRAIARLEGEVAWLRGELGRRRWRWPGLRELWRRVWEGEAQSEIRRPCSRVAPSPSPMRRCRTRESAGRVSRGMHLSRHKSVGAARSASR